MLRYLMLDTFRQTLIRQWGVSSTNALLALLSTQQLFLLFFNLMSITGNIQFYISFRSILMRNSKKIVSLTILWAATAVYVC